MFIYINKYLVDFIKISLLYTYINIFPNFISKLSKSIVIILTHLVAAILFYAL